MKKRWKIIFAVVIILAGAGFVSTQALGGVEVDVVRVLPQDITDSFTEDGEVESSEDRNVISVNSAKIEELYAEQGERVESGELIAVLDDREIEYSIRELRAQIRALDAERETLTQDPGEAELENIELGIEHAQDSLESAKNSLDRVESLYEEGLATEMELEEAEDMVNEAEYNLEQQEKSIEMLEESYDPPQGAEQVIDAQISALQSQVEFMESQGEDYEIYAPISGIVTNLEAEQGGVATPERPMMTIIQDEDYQIKSQVLTRDIYHVYQGMDVVLTQERRDEDVEFTGEVIDIAPYARETVSTLGLEEERVEVTISPDIPDDVQLGPGYQLEVEYIDDELEDELIIPKSAVFTYEGEGAVFIVENDRAELVEITTGLETNREVVITEGLSAEDLVISDPDQDGLEPGSSVNYSHPVEVEIQ